MFIPDSGLRGRSIRAYQLEDCWRKIILVSSNARGNGVELSSPLYISLQECYTNNGDWSKLETVSPVIGSKSEPRCYDD